LAATPKKISDCPTQGRWAAALDPPILPPLLRCRMPMFSLN